MFDDFPSTNRDSILPLRTAVVNQAEGNGVPTRVSTLV
jgi:hypothetical protein